MRQSSKLTREKVLPSISRNRATIPPRQAFLREEHAGLLTAVSCVFGVAPAAAGFARLKLVTNALQARRSLELDAALGPFLELRGDVFRDEHNLRGAPDEFVLLGVAWNDQCKDSRAIRRRYSDPALTALDRVSNATLKPAGQRKSEAILSRTKTLTQ